MRMYTINNIYLYDHLYANILYFYIINYTLSKLPVTKSDQRKINIYNFMSFALC